MHILVYNIFLYVYRLGVWLLSFWNPKARRWLEGRHDLIDRISTAFKHNKAPVIWMHCSSLGEFEQGRPVLEQLRGHYPNHLVVITFFSPSGYEVKKNYAHANHIFYLPFDSKINASRFLEVVKPQLVLWVKYEYWYYYLAEIKKRNIPLLLISGIFKKHQAFFRWYGRIYRYMLECFSHLFVQTRECKRLLGLLGLSRNVTVSGDTRFDRVLEIALQPEPVAGMAEFCGNSPVIVAGSTWTEDEEELDHYANTHPEIKFVIAPHEIDEEHLKDIEQLFSKTIRYSEWMTTAHTPTEKNVLIIDNIGMLSRLYRYATITYVGGGFRESGVHNVLEAAVYSKPVIFGPEYDLYVEAAGLVDSGGAFVADSAIELERKLDELLSDRTIYQQSCQAAGQFVQSNKGATEKIVSYIQEKRLLTSL